MNNIITNVRVITPDHWIEETDGKWYTHIPFECDENDDTLIEFIDSEEYINQHINDFSALNSGYTKTNMCVISANHKPTCDIQIQIKKAKDEDGRIIYTKKDDGVFEPEWLPNNPPELSIFDMLLGSNINLDNIISEATSEEDDKKEIVV